jgi:FMN phosphatase YigB (HAD superfamily)
MRVTNQSSSPFDALVLDLGGVLIKTPPHVSTNKSIPSLKRLTSTLTWMQYECDKIEEAQCYKILGEQFDFPPSELSEAIALARTTVEFDEEVVSWIQTLRQDQPSLKIIAMSNISKPDFDALHARWGPTFWSLFDEVFTSSAAGSRKPNLSFYQHVLRSTGINPEKAVFVDDSIQNTISAGSLGMRGILFENLPMLVRTVKGLLHDPVVRGKAFLQKNAKKLHSFTECGIPVLENYVQLLILEATGDEYWCLYGLYYNNDTNNDTGGSCF